MKNTKIIALALSFLGLETFFSSKAEAKMSGALTLLENADAKYAAMGEAGTAAFDDVAAMNYNPAGLGTLRTGQASFLYQKGLAEDAFGRFMIGTPMGHSALGLSVGYYNAGTVDVTDGTQTNTLTAQQDTVLGLSFAHRMGPVQMGLTTKYLHSTLVEQYSANVAAFDFGLQTGVTSRLRIGAAVQNLGNGIKYVSEADPLPTNYRLGAAYALRGGKNAPILLLDAPYFVNEKQFHPAVGLDVSVGPLSIRGGLRDNGSAREFSLGAGFLMGRSSLDYAFGMSNQMTASHRVSLSLRFGGEPQPMMAALPAPRIVEHEQKMAAQSQDEEPVKVRHTLGENSPNSMKSDSSRPREVYVVKPGDTLASIAVKQYGTASLWTSIYSANRHLIDDPTKIEAGQKIILP